MAEMQEARLRYVATDKMANTSLPSVYATSDDRVEKQYSNWQFSPSLCLLFNLGVSSDRSHVLAFANLVHCN